MSIMYSLVIFIGSTRHTLRTLCSVFFCVMLQFQSVLLSTIFTTIFHVVVVCSGEVCLFMVSNIAPSHIVALVPCNNSLLTTW